MLKGIADRTGQAINDKITPDELSKVKTVLRARWNLQRLKY